MSDLNLTAGKLEASIAPGRKWRRGNEWLAGGLAVQASAEAL